MKWGSQKLAFWVRYSPIAAAVIWLGWLILVLAMAPDEGERFSSSGQFGDSFGPLAALMSSFAAAGAITALSFQQVESSKRAFESNFFSLLSHFTTIISEIDIQEYRTVLSETGEEIDELNREFRGRDALRVMLDELRTEIDYATFPRKRDIEGSYETFYARWNDDLGHYFRSLYHIFRLINDNCPSDKMFYVRIARAHLSNSELFLLGYNLMFGEGKEKFLQLACQFCLLHNIDFSMADSRERQVFCDFPRKIFGKHRQITTAR